MSRADFAPMLLPRTGSRIGQRDSCNATLPNAPGGTGGVLPLPNSGVATWGKQGGLYLWGPNGDLQQTLLADDSPEVSAAALLPNQRILAASREGVVRIWRMYGELLAETTHDPGLSIAGAEALGTDTFITWGRASTDEGTAASDVTHVVDIWSLDGAHHRKRLHGHSDYINGMCRFHDGRFLTWDNDCLCFWTADGEPYLKPIHWDGDWLNRPVIVSDDLVAIWTVSEIMLLQIGPGSCDGKTGWEGYWFSLDRTPDGRLVAAGADGTVAILDVNPPYEMRVLQGNLESTQEGVAGVVARAKTLTHSDRIFGYDSDGGIAIWRGDGAPVLERIRGHRGDPEGATELTDGRIVTWDTQRVFRIWTEDGESVGETIDRYQHDKAVLGEVEEVVPLPNRGFAARLRNGEVALLAAEAKSLHPVKIGHGYGILGVIETRNGGGFVSSGVDDLLAFWDRSAEPQLIFEGHEDCVNGALELADGRIVSWSDDGTVRVWNADGSVAGPAFPKQELPVQHVFSIADDGYLIAVDDHAIRYLSMKARTVVATMSKHAHPILDAFCRRSGNVLSRDLDGRVLEWNLLSGRVVNRSIKGFHAYHMWEAGDGSLGFYGSDASPVDMHGMAAPLQNEQLAKAVHRVIVWPSNARRPRKVFEGRITSWMPIGERYFLAMMRDGSAHLWDFDDPEPKRSAVMRGVDHAVGLGGDQALLYLASEESGPPVTEAPGYLKGESRSGEEFFVAGSGRPRPARCCGILNAKTAQLEEIRTMPRADQIVRLPDGGFAAAWHEDRAIKTYAADGSPRSKHGYVGRPLHFGRLNDGTVGLLTDHHGQLLIYDLVL